MAVTTGAGGAPVEEADLPVIASIEPAPAAGPPQPVIPKDGFHDSREVQAAMAGGLPTQDGYPLHPAAQERLRNIQAGINAIKGWVDNMQSELSRAIAIGTGKS